MIFKRTRVRGQSASSRLRKYEHINEESRVKIGESEKRNQTNTHSEERALTVIVPQHRLILAVSETLAPNRYLASAARDEDDVELHPSSFSRTDQFSTQAQRVFFAVVRSVPVAIPSSEILTQSRSTRPPAAAAARTHSRQTGAEGDSSVSINQDS